MADKVHRARCDCSRPATIKRNGEWICEFCAKCEDVAFAENLRGTMTGRSKAGIPKLETEKIES